MGQCRHPGGISLSGLLAAWHRGHGDSDRESAVPQARNRSASSWSKTSLFIVPQVNPDGRNHSFTVYPDVAKEPTPSAPRDATTYEDCIGVDVNRNFDFLWDFATAFKPCCWRVSCSDAAMRSGGLRRPGCALTEPETRNIVWLLDEHPEIALSR